MASGMYDSARQMFLNPGTLGVNSSTAIDWNDDVIKVVLMLAAYTPVDATHDFFDDVAANQNSSTTASGANLCTLTTSSAAGVADAADTTLVATAATSSDQLVFFKETSGATSTDPLIVHITFSPSFTPGAGQTVNLVFDSGANKIFKL